MRDFVKKRGLSPVVASVLMILLVIVLTIIIFLWARGFIEERVEKFGRPIEDYCELVDFKVVAIKNGGYYILEIVNKGNVGISAFDIKVSSGGNSEVVQLEIGVPAGESVSSEVSLSFMENGEIPDEVEIFPVLSGEVKGESSRKPFVCTSEPFLLLDF